MGVPVPTRFDDVEVQMLDRLVAAGVGSNRSEVVRLAVRLLDDAERRAADGRAIAASYAALPQAPEEDAQALANAAAMVRAEPW